MTRRQTRHGSRVMPSRAFSHCVCKMVTERFARSICMQTNACVLQKKAGLSNEQVEALITLRENYMGRTRRILQHRQSLWQTVRANLLDSSLLDGSPSAERKICSFEKMLELRRNMDDFHWNFAWMMREWLMRHLSPLQVRMPPAQPRV